MSYESYINDCDQLREYLESVQGIEKDIKYMDSELKCTDTSELSDSDKKYVSTRIDDGKDAIQYIKEFNKIVDKYINSHGFIRMDFVDLSDQKRKNVMKTIGRKYDEIYDSYGLFWSMYSAMADFRYVSRIKAQKYIR